MTPNPTPISLLVEDLEEILADAYDPVAKAALRRVGLFRLMYLEGKDMGGKLALRTVDGQVIVADELDPQGRCHVLAHPPFYAMFDKENMVLEYRKAALEIETVLYEADEWPALLDKNPESVRRYFERDAQ